MPIFADNYKHIQLPVETDSKPGLRRAQLGALYALASHFTIRDESALVSLPTGSGKTAVLILSAFVQRANRALVITPSKLVRSQISEEFSTLATLTKIGAYPGDGAKPHVHELVSRITSNDDWEALRKFDVVVATPSCASPALNDVPSPPGDLFDLLLIDEAHHSPARTWNQILESFDQAKRALFTATPFRRDRREISARFVYNFPLREAHKDRIFGDIRYVPVTPNDGESADAAIARTAEATFQADNGAGLKHLLMVRTDTRTRANELKTVYKKHTDLKLQVIHSGHTYSHIKSSIKKLRKGDLNGIICVDMLGEGFDLPNLKIAAIHSPHKSLEVTLQFIGRFARTAGQNLGEAKFLAIPSEVEIETTRLYEEDAIWHDIIANLSQSRIESEQDIREKLDTFDPPSVLEFATEDLSLYSLKPYCHVKIFEAKDPVDINTEITLPKPYQIVFQQVSTKLSAAVLIAREYQQPRWTDLAAFSSRKYELFLVYYDASSGLLFINSSRRTESMYEDIAIQYSEVFFPLSLSRVNRVLRGMENTKFFNVGMKNRLLNSNTESYRIISGSQAEKAIDETDGQLYHRGHVFGRGDEDSEAATIGYSSQSKVWSNRNLQIPSAIAWCKSLAAKIADSAPVVTQSGLDNLTVGQEIAALPTGLLAAEWDSDAYRSPPVVRYQMPGNAVVERQLLDMDIVIDRDHCTDQNIPFALVNQDIEMVATFRLNESPRFEIIDSGRQFTVLKGSEAISLAAYLNASPLHFYFANMSRLNGNELFTYNAGQFSPYPANDIEVIDWAGSNVDIQREFWAGGTAAYGKLSLHDFLRDTLNVVDNEVVIYDHRSGEVADFITMSEATDAVDVCLYHCKGAGGPKPGDRVGDVYEVCGQAAKCLMWLDDYGRLLAKLKHRVNTGSPFVRGDWARVEELLTNTTKPIRPVVALVQPGITKAKLSEASARVLAATRDYLRRVTSDKLRLIASA